MKKLYIVYFYHSADEDLKDCDLFVAESTKDIEEQFIDFAKYSYDIDITEDDIDDYFEVKNAEDKNGKEYKIKLCL
jgi:hypothetical protein